TRAARAVDVVRARRRRRVDARRLAEAALAVDVRRAGETVAIAAGARSEAARDADRRVRRVDGAEHRHDIGRCDSRIELRLEDRREEPALTRARIEKFLGTDVSTQRG